MNPQRKPSAAAAWARWRGSAPLVRRPTNPCGSPGIRGAVERRGGVAGINGCLNHVNHVNQGKTYGNHMNFWILLGFQDEWRLFGEVSSWNIMKHWALYGKLVFCGDVFGVNTSKRPCACGYFGCGGGWGVGLYWGGMLTFIATATT